MTALFAASGARPVRPVVPPPGAEAVPAEARGPALAALAELREAAAGLDNPDLFHRPRLRTRLHPGRLAGADPGRLADQAAASAGNRAEAGLLAVASVRAELRERPGQRPCFTPDALVDLHRLLVAEDPSVPGGGGLRRTDAHVVWPDGRRFAIAVPPGRPLRGHLRRWHHWTVNTDSPALDLAAFGVLRLYTVHPFPDGNGRLARLLAQCDLVAAGLLPGLLLDLDGWVEARRATHDEAIVAGADGDWARWGTVFADAVTETARHRTTTLAAHRRLLTAAIDAVREDPQAVGVLRRFTAAPAVSADWLRSRLPYDPGPALARLRRAGLLTRHPRLPGALVHPGLLALLDTPFAARLPDEVQTS